VRVAGSNSSRPHQSVAAKRQRITCNRSACGARQRHNATPRRNRDRVIMPKLCSHKAFEIEFMTLDGQTAAVATVEASAVRSVIGRDISHSRHLQSS
jgi:hypothetical protein